MSYILLHLLFILATNSIRNIYFLFSVTLKKWMFDSQKNFSLESDPFNESVELNRNRLNFALKSVDLKNEYELLMNYCK